MRFELCVTGETLENEHENKNACKTNQGQNRKKTLRKPNRAKQKRNKERGKAGRETRTTTTDHRLRPGLSEVRKKGSPVVEKKCGAVMRQSVE